MQKKHTLKCIHYPLDYLTHLLSLKKAKHSTSYHKTSVFFQILLVTTKKLTSTKLQENRQGVMHLQHCQRKLLLGWRQQVQRCQLGWNQHQRQPSWPEGLEAVLSFFSLQVVLPHQQPHQYQHHMKARLSPQWHQQQHTISIHYRKAPSCPTTAATLPESSSPSHAPCHQHWRPGAKMAMCWLVMLHSLLVKKATHSGLVAESTCMHNVMAKLLYGCGGQVQTVESAFALCLLETCGQCTHDAGAFAKWFHFCHICRRCPAHHHFDPMEVEVKQALWKLYRNSLCRLCAPSLLQPLKALAALRKLFCCSLWRLSCILWRLSCSLCKLFLQFFQASKIAFHNKPFLACFACQYLLVSMFLCMKMLKTTTSFQNLFCVSPRFITLLDFSGKSNCCPNVWKSVICEIISFS